MTRPGLATLSNRRALAFADVPTAAADAFRVAVAQAVSDGCRVISFFGMPDGTAVRLVAILADDAAGSLHAIGTMCEGEYPSLSPALPGLARFEREIAEQCGVMPTGHPGLKPLRRHAPDHAPATRHAVPGSYRFDRIEGDDVHEVAVGPVHAGIIEPGHFRFQAYGEEVLQLEIMLGYQHRGVERLLETLPAVRAMYVAESIAGDTVVGHAGAYCGAIEALARCRKTPRAQSIRGIALELERLANHIGDLGAVAGDIAYHPGAAYFGRMRGECLNLLMAMSGNRYGRGLVRPGGSAFDVPPALADAMRDRLRRLERDLVPMAEMMLGNASVQSRLEGVGVVSAETCERLGLVGPAARACEVARDVRHDHPWGIFRFAHIPVATAWAGDVLARVLVRWLEVQRSLEFVLEQLGALPRGDARVPAGPLRPGELVVSLVEGWRGEIVHVAITDERGAMRRYKVTDPSFHNWPALAAAMRGQQISDFPLCNKSFNLSYAGHDL